MNDMFSAYNRFYKLYSCDLRQRTSWIYFSYLIDCFCAGVSSNRAHENNNLPIEFYCSAIVVSFITLPYWDNIFSHTIISRRKYWWLITELVEIATKCAWDNWSSSGKPDITTLGLPNGFLIFIFAWFALWRNGATDIAG